MIFATGGRELSKQTMTNYDAVQHRITAKIRRVTDTAWLAVAR
jgi:hypothetical protein